MQYLIPQQAKIKPGKGKPQEDGTKEINDVPQGHPTEKPDKDELEPGDEGKEQDDSQTDSQGSTNLIESLSLSGLFQVPGALKRWNLA